MDKILTVVIPAYNIEKYVDQCLGSFVEPQILKDIEVLVVNDGSSDRTVELAEKYVRNYPDTFRIIDKENGGHGSTINRGIQEAEGRYFKVVDGDDWVDGPALVKLVHFLAKTHSDYVVTRYYWVKDGTGERKLEFKEPFSGVEYEKEYAFSQVSQKVFLKMHALTIRTEILRKIPKIDEHCFYVDMEYVLFPVPYIQTVTFLQEVVYQYRIGLPSQSMNMRSMQRNEDNYTRVLNRLLAYYAILREEAVPEYCLAYLEHCIGRMTATRFKIFLSFPWSREVQSRMVAFDKGLKTEYPAVYNAVINRSVILLRKTGYSLYPAARAIFCMKVFFSRIQAKIHYKRKDKKTA